MTRRRYRKPTELDKAFMQQHIRRKIEAEYGKGELSAEREWLSEVFNCKSGSVQAISAHARIRFNDVVPGKLTIANADFARRCIECASTTAEERTQAQEELARWLQVPLPLICSITDGVRSDTEDLFETEELEQAESASQSHSPTRQLTESDKKLIRHFVAEAEKESKRAVAIDQLSKHFKIPASTVEHVLTEQSAVTTPWGSRPITADDVATLEAVEAPRGGDLVDYDKDIKDKWRNECDAFIDEHTVAVRRPRQKQLILPSWQCLDVPHSLRLGYRPENVIAYEGGSYIARAKCSRTVREKEEEWGGKIDLRLARLEHELATDKDRLGSAVLDFVGQMCPQYIKIASDLLLNEEAVVIMNSMARRETQQLQDDMQSMVEQIEASRVVQREVILAHRSLYAGGAARTGGEQTPEYRQRDIAELRDSVSLALMNVGKNRKENWQFVSTLENLPILPEVENMRFIHGQQCMEQNLNIALQPLLTKLLPLLQDHGLFQPKDLNELMAMANMGRMFHDALFGRSLITDMRKIGYRSETGAQVQDFHTDMAAFKRPVPLYQKVSPAVEFLLKCTEHCLRYMDKSGERDGATDQFQFVMMRNDQFLRPGEAKKRDHIACLHSGALVDRKPVHVLLNAASEYYDTSRRFPVDDPVVQADIERTTLV